MEHPRTCWGQKNEQKVANLADNYGFFLLAIGLVGLNNLNYIYSQRISKLKEEREIWLAKYNRIRAEYYRNFPIERYYKHVAAESNPDTSGPVGRSNIDTTNKDTTAGR